MKIKYTILSLSLASLFTVSTALAGSNAQLGASKGGNGAINGSPTHSIAIGSPISPMGNGDGTRPVPDPTLNSTNVNGAYFNNAGFSNTKFGGITANGNGNGTLPVPDPSLSSTSGYSLLCLLGLCTQP